MGAVTFRYYYVFRDTNQPSYDPSLTSQCGWTAKTNPRPTESPDRSLHSFLSLYIYCPPLRPLSLI